jgi:hypothetical protein
LPARPRTQCRLSAANKFEYRNPKFETNTKQKIRKFQKRKGAFHRFGHLNLVHWILFRISCFVFRILTSSVYRTGFPHAGQNRNVFSTGAPQRAQVRGGLNRGSPASPAMVPHLRHSRKGVPFCTGIRGTKKRDK